MSAIAEKRKSRQPRETVTKTFKNGQYEILNVPYIRSKYNKKDLHLSGDVVLNIAHIIKRLKAMNETKFDYNEYKKL